jgi:hypothetical protein
MDAECRQNGLPRLVRLTIGHYDGYSRMSIAHRASAVALDETIVYQSGEGQVSVGTTCAIDDAVDGSQKVFLCRVLVEVEFDPDLGTATRPVLFMWSYSA